MVLNLVMTAPVSKWMEPSRCPPALGIQRLRQSPCPLHAPIEARAMVSTCARGCFAFARVVGKLLQPVVQRLQADPKRGCGALLVVAAVREAWPGSAGARPRAIEVPTCTVIVLPFCAERGLRAVRSATMPSARWRRGHCALRRAVARQPFVGDGVAGGHHVGALHDVAQLAHVARPAVALELGQRLAREALGRALALADTSPGSARPAARCRRRARAAAAARSGTR